MDYSKATEALIAALAKDYETVGGFSDVDLALDEISRYFDDCERWGRGSWARALSQVSRERDELPDLYDAMISLGSAKGWA